MGNRCKYCKHCVKVQEGDEHSPYKIECHAIEPETDPVTGVQEFADPDLIRGRDKSCWLYERDGGFFGWLWDLILDLPWIFR